MKALLLVLALGVLAAQDPPALPPGQFCTHVEAGKPSPHPCACQRECVDTTWEDTDGTQHPTVGIKEDPKCKQYCSASHCHCPVKNCP
jgi:hypothetical protein